MIHPGNGILFSPKKQAIMPWMLIWIAREVDHKEGWAPNNWWFQIVVLEKTLMSHLDRKKINPVNPKGNQSWIFTGRTDAEAEAPILGHLMQRADSLEKTLMLERWKAGEGRQNMRWLDGIIDSIDVNFSKLQEMVKDRKAWRVAVHAVAKSQKQLSD